jgi:hypothetical protein
MLREDTFVRQLSRNPVSKVRIINWQNINIPGSEIKGLNLFTFFLSLISFCINSDSLEYRKGWRGEGHSLFP